jgi:hypothetical protein
MTKRQLMFAAAVLLTTCGAAHAFDLPKYDSAAFCKATSSIIVVSEDFKKQMIEACMKKEQEAPAQIMRIIPYVDQAAVKGCEIIAPAYAGGSYQGFVGCLVLCIVQPILEGKLELRRKSERAEK